MPVLDNRNNQQYFSGQSSDMQGSDMQGNGPTNMHGQNLPNQNLSNRHLANKSLPRQSLKKIQKKTAQDISKNILFSEGQDVVRNIQGMDDVIVRNSGVTFQKTYDSNGQDPNEIDLTKIDRNNGTGGYTVQKDGTKQHITGTTDDGSSVASHSVDSQGKVKLNRYYKGDRTYDSVVASTIRKLGLIDKGHGIYTRPGYTGEYRTQIERDGSFSIFYRGGKDASGRGCSAQTFHHGYWDYSQSRRKPEPNQRQRKIKYNLTNGNRITSVKAANSLKTTQSSFSTKTTALVLDNNGKLSQGNTKLAHLNFEKITADESTWAGSYTKNTGYSFARQLNGQSGILNLKENTVNAAQNVVSATFKIAINHHLEEQTEDGLTYRSLLTDKKIFTQVDGKDTVVELKANGDVIDHTNSNIYKININEGEGISWKKGLLSAEQNKDSTFAPSKAPIANTQTPEQELYWEGPRQETPEQELYWEGPRQETLEQDATTTPELSEQEKTAITEKANIALDKLRELGLSNLALREHGLGIDQDTTSMIFNLKDASYITIDAERHYTSEQSRRKNLKLNNYEKSNSTREQSIADSISKITPEDLKAIVKLRDSGLEEPNAILVKNHSRTYSLFPISENQVISVNLEELPKEISKVYRSAAINEREVKNQFDPKVSAYSARITTDEWFKIEDNGWLANESWGYIDSNGGKVYISDHKGENIRTWQPEAAVTNILEQNREIRDDTFGWGLGWYDVNDHPTTKVTDEKTLKELKEKTTEGMKESKEKLKSIKVPRLKHLGFGGSEY